MTDTPDAPGVASEPIDNVLVLLGAGASVDAGVPASTQMTQAIVEAIATPQNEYHGTAHALNYAVGALVAHNSARGENPYNGIDIERLFSAVQMLGDKESLEIAPFVSWSPILNTIGPKSTTPSFFNDNFSRALLGKGTSNVGDLIAELVSNVVRAEGSEKVYQRLEEQMLESLKQLIQVDGVCQEFGVNSFVLG